MELSNWWIEKGHLEVVDNQLTIADNNTVELAKEFGTPLFIYNIDKVISNYRKVNETFTEQSPKQIEARVYYAMKANGHEEILKALLNEEAFIDATSINEIKAALEIGCKPEKIIFTGINFGLKNFEFLAKSGVLINVDSFSQIRRLAEYSPLNISIRWNPGFGIGFHKGLTMGGKRVGNLKLGIYKDKVLDAFKEAKALGLNPIGLHHHIGSNWFGDQLAEFLKSVELTLELAEQLIINEGITLEMIDFGGGLGVRSTEHYPEFPLEKYCNEIWQRVNNKSLPIKIISIEPGRYITGNAGILLTTVNMVENKGGVDFVGIDAGFNLFNHYFFFEIEPEFINCSRVMNQEKGNYSIGGYLCESSDIFSTNKVISEINETDILAIYPAGAYGAAEMAKYHKRDTASELIFYKAKDLSVNIIDYCKICRNNCCYFGPVFLLPEEFNIIKEYALKQKLNPEEIFKKKNGYYVIYKTSGEPCVFLDQKNNQCKIHEIKPLECKVWPVYLGKGGNINKPSFSVDCPASKFLSEKYIENAQNLLSEIPINYRKEFYINTKKLGYKTKDINSK